ncbi:phenylalanyl-tRNA synthetase beta chain domain protein [Mycobacterium kansasii]|uniref:Phenylalanyl-tRNA synthetase beta chain domain protein n=1 Tax=Mycobacterium kansasii TaxID=1768 RepID=A0A1V3WHS9_MYCKA|nr:phenylalanyl-tRNA synthetase beta chain domain protein [Mycobacterium kansasii]
MRIIARASGIDVTLRAARYLPWHPAAAPKYSSAKAPSVTRDSCIRP